MPKYATYELASDWPELVATLNLLEDKLRASGRPIAADLILTGYVAMKHELIGLGRTLSMYATEALRESERKTRVRPDTHGGGGARLEDSLVAAPLDEQLYPGSIGVADLELLEADVPWWITNEIGSTARIGGHLFGYFHGEQDAQPPDQDQFREHPLFQADPEHTSPVSGKGLIEAPIPARRFVEKAVPVINERWRVEFAAIKDRMHVVMTQAMATYR